MTTDTNEPKMPHPLDNTKLHSPAVVRAHQRSVEDYWASMRAQARDAERRVEAEKTFANRVLGEAEWFAMAQERENKKRQQEFDRQAATFAAEQEKAAFMASRPATIEILENNDAEYLRLLQHFLHAGYEIDWAGPRAMLPPTLYHVTLKAAAPEKKARKEAA